MVMECIRESVTFIGIVFGIPGLLFGLFRAWQVFIAPTFRRRKRR